MLPVRVTVNTPGTGPASVAVPVVAASVTVGSATSSLTIVTVPLLGAPTVYAALALSVATTVSSLSTAVSLRGHRDRRRRRPAAIVTLPDSAV